MPVTEKIVGIQYEHVLSFIYMMIARSLKLRLILISLGFKYKTVNEPNLVWD